MQSTPQSDAVSFLTAIFEPGDLVLVRPVEIWNDSDGKKQSRVVFDKIQYVRLGVRHPGGGWQFVPSQIERLIGKLNETAAAERANIFFGVCPRFGGGGEFDRAWQIRTVRCMWADLDAISPESAMAKCDAAKLPNPSIAIRSGNGVHLYWILDEPVLLDDYESDPVPIRMEYSDTPDPKTGKRRGRAYFADGGGSNGSNNGNGKGNSDKTYLTAATRPELSPKAALVTEALQGIARQIAIGDHTHDLTRLLRLPGTMNRKNERNGERPKPCEVWRM